MDKLKNRTATQRFIRGRINELLLLENRARKERQILESALAQLAAVSDVIEIPVPAPNGKLVARLHEGLAPEHVGMNALTIHTIIHGAGKALSVRDIAHAAYESGQIKSGLGYKGVYNIVQTVLKRNRKKFFRKVSRGVWDMKDRAELSQIEEQSK